MRPVVELPVGLAGGRLFTTEEALAAGLTHHQLGGRAVRRLVRGVYVDARVPPSTDQLRDAVELRCPEGVWLGDVAVDLWGLPQRLIPSTDAPHVLLPADAHCRTPRQGFRVTVGQFDDSDVVLRGGRRVLCPAALMIWLARDWPLEDLVAFGDAALARKQMTLKALDDVLRRYARHPGIAGATRARGLLSARSKSPMESRLRVAFVLAGLPMPEVNGTVSWEPAGYLGPAADLLGELDLLWRKARVGVEYDGVDHAKPRARSNDRSKRKLFERHGWEVVVVTAWDYFNRLDSVIEEVRALLMERGGLVG